VFREKDFELDHSYVSFLQSLSSTGSGSGSPEKQPLKRFYVYILCSKRNGTLYTGVTSNLPKRVYEHKRDLANGFTKKYNVHSLVWYEVHESWESAFQREKQIKKWKRA
jgi:putative endonuclease